MKRFFILCSIYFIFLCVPIKANTNIEYIVYTSDKDSLIEVKTKVLDIMDTLLMGVKEQSYTSIIKENIQLFCWDDDVEASFKNHTVVIVIGKGNGEILHGEYEKRNVCMAKVKKKSMLKEWWKKSKE